VLYNNICYIVAGSWSAVEKWSGNVVPKCYRKGGWADFKRQRMVKKNFAAEKVDYGPE